MQGTATKRSHKKRVTEAPPAILPPGWTSGVDNRIKKPFVHPPVGELCAGFFDPAVTRPFGRSERMRGSLTQNYLQTHASYIKEFGSDGALGSRSRYNYKLTNGRPASIDSHTGFHMPFNCSAPNPANYKLTNALPL